MRKFFYLQKYKRQKIENNMKLAIAFHTRKMTGLLFKEWQVCQKIKCILKKYQSLKMNDIFNKGLGKLQERQTKE